MRRHVFLLAFILVLTIAADASDRVENRVAAEALGRFPLYFEPNEGQASGAVRFLGRAGGLAVLLDAGGHFQLISGAGPEADLEMRLVGSQEPGAALGSHRFRGASNYFLGADSRGWKTRVPHFGKVRYSAVYAGVDLVYYGNQRRLEYDFLLAPGVSARRIGMEFGSADSLRIDSNGDLLIATRSGEYRQLRPEAFQERAGKRVTISCEYLLERGGVVRFRLGAYDADLPLTIDPVVDFSTFIGGSGDDIANDIALDAAGNIYVAGHTNSAALPAAGAGYQATLGGGRDIFVSKLSPDGGTLIYSTYLGGWDTDRANALAVDSSGSVYLTGYGSFGFPSTPEAYRTRCCGATVVKLSPGGDALEYATFLGSGEGYDIAVDSGGNAYLTGLAYSSYPTTAGAFDSVFGGGTDAFVTKLDSTGASLVYSTFLGGSAYDRAYGLAVESSGEVYVTGSTYSTNFPVTAGALQTAAAGHVDGFVVKLNAAGSGLVYSTLLGGGGRDEAFAVALGSGGSAYVAGLTSSPGFPLTPGAYRTVPPVRGYSGFVTALNAEGSLAIYSTLLGPVKDYYDLRFGLAVDVAGAAYVTGAAEAGFPTTPDAFQPSAGGGTDAFLIGLNPAGSAALDATFLGGSANDYGRALTLDASGRAYLAGMTASGNFPVTTGAAQATSGGGVDAFVTRVEWIASSCSYTISPANTAFHASGGSAALGVTTSSSCVWSASSDVGWVAITAGGSGLGSGVVNYLVSPNPLSVPRQGIITVAGQTHVVTQAGAMVPVPNQPSGPTTVGAGNSYAFLASGSYIAGGGSVEYRFDWGDGRISTWRADTQAVTWASSGTRQVRAQARDVLMPSVVSGWSPVLSVTTLDLYEVLNDQEYISQTYLDVFNRGVDGPAYTAWLNGLGTGAVTRAEMISSLLQDVEYANYGGFTVRCYLAIMKRVPDFGGWLYWYGRMREGTSQTIVIESFMWSPEFQSIYGSLNDEEFVDMVYQNVLGRAPDQAGLTYWLGQLTSGAVTRSVMLAGFISSPEYIAATANEVAAISLSLTLWRRSPTDTEYATWLPLVQAGMLTSTAEGIITGPEYLLRFP